MVKRKMKKENKINEMIKNTTVFKTAMKYY